MNERVLDLRGLGTLREMEEKAIKGVLGADIGFDVALLDEEGWEVLENTYVFIYDEPLPQRFWGMPVVVLR